MIARALGRFVDLRHDDGSFEGFSDAGVVFDAANVLLSRFVDETWPEDPARITAKMRHVLSGQHESGLFWLYPNGPVSVDATRIVVLTIDRVLEDIPRLEESFRAELAAARGRAAEAIERPPADHFELLYLTGFRAMLGALDANPLGASRTFPAPKLLTLVPLLGAGLLPRALTRWSDRIVYPFIEVLPELLGWATRRALGASKVGAAVQRALAALPYPVRSWRRSSGKKAAEWLLDRQDDGGGFYYSPLYTYLFVAALRDAMAQAASERLTAEGAAAIDRALAYVRAREVTVPTGLSTSFVASDVWDTGSVAMVLLEANGVDVPSALDPAALGAWVLPLQSEGGGYSYGRGSKFPDVDTTALVLGLQAALLVRDPASAERSKMLDAIGGAFDFLHTHRNANGGFNAWTLLHGEKAPPLSAQLSSMLFDVASADVTARVAVALGRVISLVRSDADARAHFGEKRLDRALSLRRGALDYLRAARDPWSGLWPARWSLGFTIGTRFALDALDSYDEVGLTERRAFHETAARTLISAQNDDGGFGESPRSDLDRRYTPSRTSNAFMTAAACDVLRRDDSPSAQQGCARALAYLERTQLADGSWPEWSVCTQFAGLYASYALMTQVAVTTTLLRER
ncbi:MAG TPA: prenyltransferase/squalene oxidase repeat-containing protein [Polyangiaceae bacterium]